MQDLWQQFLALDPNARAVVVGVLVTLVIGAVKLVWKGFAVSDDSVKFVTAVVLAGVAGYTQGGWPGAALALLIALGTHDAGKRVLRGVVQPLIADYRLAVAEDLDEGG